MTSASLNFPAVSSGLAWGILGGLERCFGDGLGSEWRGLSHLPSREKCQQLSQCSVMMAPLYDIIHDAKNAISFNLVNLNRALPILSFAILVSAANELFSSPQSRCWSRRSISPTRSVRSGVVPSTGYAVTPCWRSDLSAYRVPGVGRMR
jgi:hypothetical protein